jgi:1-acyl-sn-glycerol-3-phosphate acyltransferase
MSTAASPQLDRWGRSAESSTAKALIRVLYRHWFRVEWEGVENIPQHGGALLVANHAGMLPADGALIQYGVEEELSRSVYALAHHGFFDLPFVGNVLERSGSVVGHPDNAHRLLAEDRHLVLVFPEGQKGPVKAPSERYRLQRFGRGGFVESAIRSGVPIVPIALMGTEDATPVLAQLRAFGQEFPLTLNALMFGPIIGAFTPFPAKVRARVLPALQWDHPPGLEHYPRSVVMDRAEEVRTSIQEALDAMVRTRQSVWTG